MLFFFLSFVDCFWTWTGTSSWRVVISYVLIPRFKDDAVDFALKLEVSFYSSPFVLSLMLPLSAIEKTGFFSFSYLIDIPNMF